MKCYVARNTIILGERMKKKDSSDRLLKIGELARLTKVSTRTIRFYVEEGLLPQPVKKHRNMAYYDPDSVRKIKAIKKAQSERFLPLVVIGRILEENDYDFSALEQPYLPSSTKESALNSRNWEEISKPLLLELFHRHWITANLADRLSGSEKLLLDFIYLCLGRGLNQEIIIGTFEALESIIEKLVETEFQVFLSRLADIRRDDFDSFVEKERLVVQQFIWNIRERYLKSIFSRHNRTVDNAVLAASDEGYGIPLEEVKDDLNQLETRLRRGSRDVQLLIDLGTGYSCVGDQEKAMTFLRRAMKSEPDSIAAKVRWC